MSLFKSKFLTKLIPENFLNTSGNVQVDNTILKEHKSEYSSDIEMIHKEFFCAADNLVVEAKKTIAEADRVNVSKVAKLESLGFKQASEVVEKKPLLEKAKLSNEQIELLKYYQINYPNNKFITEEQVETICKKYGLVCGDVSRFKGFVPDKNLKEIEQFKLKSADIILDASISTYGSDLGTIKEDGGKQAISYPSIYKLRLGNKILKICAPVKDMDMSNMTIEYGYRMREIPKYIPDPVVLQPVKGGYLILTAWGDEASDPIVVNEKMN